jgi:putative hydrolase of the HAD superfamily
VIEGRAIEAVLFDLDDTLYSQADFLRGAWRAVADTAADWVIEAAELTAALERTASEGSDRGRVIDRALERLHRSDIPVEPLIRTFRAYRPIGLALYPGALAGLNELRRAVPVAVVTDGDPAIQIAKLEALGLTDTFDAVILSDEFGRSRRKPNPTPFLAAAAALRVSPAGCVMVGDRPDKDIFGARNAGLLGAIRVRTGEYQEVDDVASCLASLPDVTDAIRWLIQRLATTNETRAASSDIST